MKKKPAKRKRKALRLILVVELREPDTGGWPTVYSETQCKIGEVERVVKRLIRVARKAAKDDPDLRPWQDWSITLRFCEP